MQLYLAPMALPSATPMAGLKTPQPHPAGFGPGQRPVACTSVKFSGLPIIKGTIARRILVNYTADPDVVQKLLPAPFKPKLMKGKAVVGICLIRLEKIRPKFLPAWMGISSENVAHRFAVTWTENGVQKEGVYIVRRDSNSKLNQLVGGRLFPGVHHASRFDVQEKGDDFSLKINSKDKAIAITVEGSAVKALPASSIFAAIEEASDFFAKGSLGYSPGTKAGKLDGMELRTQDWKVEPMAIKAVSSSYFEDTTLFPKGSIQFDSALLMRNLAHEWHDQGGLCLDNCKL